MKRTIFPFSAVLGQECVKNALIWNFINPHIGGVLLSGQKGTAKSTLVRASACLSGKKLVELPLNITEDRLIGAIDFESAIRYGVKRLDHGILAEADQNILYVDEINLLSDSVTKTLLEAASSGFCRVEREGISDDYPCDFILVGSMNPEESGLRPQLLDRFGLYVDVQGETDPALRCEIIRRRIAFEAEPDAFVEQYRAADDALRQRIETARARLPQIQVPDSALALAAQLARNANCAGSRGELAIVETARAICAWNGIPSVNQASVSEAAKYALPHRMRDSVLPETACSQPEQPPGQEHPPERSEGQPPEPAQEEGQGTENGALFEQSQMPMVDGQEQVEASAPPFDVGKWLAEKSKICVRHGSGRRSLVKTSSLQGRYVKSQMSSRERTDLAFDATLRAAAPYQASRDKHGLALAIETSDIRTKVREKRTGNFIVFAVDASGSMGVGKRMAAVKGAILSLLNDAYQKRDKVAMVTFRRDKAELTLGMTRSVDLAAKRLEVLATGGRTPLYAGLELAHSVIRAARQKEKDLLPVLVLVSDGRATAGRSGSPYEDAAQEARAIAADRIPSVVIDVEQDLIKLRLAGKLAKEMNAQVYQIEELHANAILSAVSMAVHRAGGTV